MPQGPLAANIAKTPTNALTSLTTGKSLNLLISDAHGQAYEASYAQRMAFCANPSGVTTSAGLATTYVGLCLSNPAGSGKNLSIITVSAALIVAPATITTLQLILGFTAGGVTAHTTPLTPGSEFIGGSAAGFVGLVDSACTLVGTPVWGRILFQCGTATTAVGGSLNVQGSIIIPPGAYCAIGTNIAGPASGFKGSFHWEEIAP